MTLIPQTVYCTLKEVLIPWSLSYGHKHGWIPNTLSAQASPREGRRVSVEAPYHLFSPKVCTGSGYLHTTDHFTTHYPFLITYYSLRTAHYSLPITHYRLQTLTTQYPLSTTHYYPLPTTTRYRPYQSCVWSFSVSEPWCYSDTIPRRWTDDWTESILQAG